MQSRLALTGTLTQWHTTRLLFNTLTTSLCYTIVILYANVLCLCGAYGYIHHSKQYIHDSNLQSDNHVMQTTSSHSHTHSGWELRSGGRWDGLEWLTDCEKHITNYACEKFLSSKMEWNGMESKWVCGREWEWELFLLTGIAYCLSAAKWMLFHIHILPRSMVSSICPCFSRIKRRPCTAFVCIVMAISITCTQSYTTHIF